MKGTTMAHKIALRTNSGCTARPWLPLSLRDAVVAAGAQNVGA